jgi:hypothetical protein
MLARVRTSSSLVSGRQKEREIKRNREKGRERKREIKRERERERERKEGCVGP